MGSMKINFSDIENDIKRIRGIWGVFLINWHPIFIIVLRLSSVIFIVVSLFYLKRFTCLIE